jgi:long-subunit acyl-CoA synthetase (AMP-forming)
MVAVFMPNKPLFSITCLGAAKIGIPFTVVDPASSPFELQHQLKDSRAIYIVTTNKLLPVVRQVTAAMRGLKEILILDREDEEKKELRFTIEMKYNLLFGKPPGWGALPDWTVKPEDVAAIHYGPAIRGAKPKGLVVTHRNLISNVIQAEKALSVSKDDVLLSALPYFRLDTYTLINNLAIHKGAKSISLEDATAVNLVEAIQEQKVTILRVTVPLLAELVNAKADLSSLKRVIVDPSEAALSPSVESVLKKNFPNISLGFSYAAPLLIHLNADSRGTGAGRLLAGTSAMITDASGPPLSGDKDGLLLVKGDQVPTTFLNSEEANKTNFRDGFLITGDRAKVDKDGNFHIAARPPVRDD